MVKLLLEMKVVAKKYSSGYRDEVCRFTTDFDVPFDNNKSECSISIAKVKQKVSCDFRSKEGADAFAGMQSFIQTTHKQSRSV